MKIVKICLKSPWFTVCKMFCMHAIHAHFVVTYKVIHVCTTCTWTLESPCANCKSFKNLEDLHVHVWLNFEGLNKEWRLHTCTMYTCSIVLQCAWYQQTLQMYMCMSHLSPILMFCCKMQYLHLCQFEIFVIKAAERLYQKYYKICDIFYHNFKNKV